MAELIYREEPGSEVTLGPFDSAFYYDIEGSRDAKISRTETMKSVECVVLRGRRLLFIEAKKTAPRELTAQSAVRQIAGLVRLSARLEYEELLRRLSVTPAYVQDVCEKFLLSMCLVLSIAEGRIDSEDMPPSMREAIRDPSVRPVFVLVITWSEADWIVTVQDAFNMALKKFEKTNRARVLVLTAEQARSKGLVSAYTPMPAAPDT